MAIIETVFDITYLTLVIALGARLLALEDKGARLFGLMAVLLGAGDAFHLIPRIVSHWSPGGFAAHAAALSWGQFVTSITMTIFYLLYYVFYKRQTGKGTPAKDMLVYLLAGLRIVLIALPQNGWGTQPGSYSFGIIRNIPFAVLGVLLIAWSYQERRTEGMRHMAVLIFFSFLFYIPVVLWAQFVPVIGALMMPKTAAYLLLVMTGYRYFMEKYRRRSLA